MDWFVRNFIKASLAWLGLAVSLGLAMAAHPAWVVYRTAHLHMALLGFVAMMIFGVAYHVIPRFEAAYWLVTVGTAGRVAGELARPYTDAFGVRVATLAAGVPQVAGIGVFYTMWHRIRPAGSRTREAHGERF